MKQYDCSSNIMTIDETLWLFIKQYNCWWNNMVVHQIVWLFILSSKFQVPSSKWYYKYPYNNIRKPNRRVCPSWLNLLHNRNPHLETLGGSVSFQCVINIPLFIYKLHQHVFLSFFPWSSFCALLVCTVLVHFPSLSSVFFPMLVLRREVCNRGWGETTAVAHDVCCSSHWNLCCHYWKEKAAAGNTGV